MSGFAFRNGISANIVGGRVILLDLDSDRYFGVAESLDISLRKAVAHETLASVDANNLETLCRHHILVRSDDGALPIICASPATPVASLLDHSPLETRWLGRSRAAAAILRAQVQLRLYGLAKSVARLRCCRNRPGHDDPTALRTIAAEFAGAVAWVGALDQCLAHSLAVAHRLAAAGLNHQFVMGVSVRPFRAHAWVQSGDTVVNDHVDLVRRFTPILIV